MHPFQPTLLTLYDATTDSPVYRANVHYFDEQLDQLEKWLTTLSKHLKSYAERLNKLNLETQILCSKAIPTGIDDALIDPNLTGVVIKGFTHALQSSLSFKARLICDLEENLVEPLQQFVKTHVKDFKSFRKQHVRALEQYEAQLVKYAALGQQKDPSALREEAFRLYEARKAYVKMSGQHVIRIQSFRFMLEHCLVEQFSAATVAHKDFNESGDVWRELHAAMNSWKQWLTEDRLTCNFQLRKQQVARELLESDYLEQVRPGRDLNTYIGKRDSSQSVMSVEHENGSIGGSKWGYLFVKDSSRHWVRKWFYMHNGYFGVCTPSRSQKGGINVESRISVLGCEVKPLHDSSRRFSFEVVNRRQKRTEYVLQAETKSCMMAWVAAFDKSNRWVMDDTQQGPCSTKGRPSYHRCSNESLDSSRLHSKALGINNKSHSTTAVSIPVTLSVGTSASNLSCLSNVSGLSTSPGSILLAPSAVFLSTSPHPDTTLSNSVSLTPLLVSEASKQWTVSTPSPTRSGTVSSRRSSWGIPSSLVPSIQNTVDDDTKSFGSLNTPGIAEAQRMVWPAKPEVNSVPIVEVDQYPEDLHAKNAELRRLFDSIVEHEVVLDAFILSLKKQPSPMPNDAASAAIESHHLGVSASGTTLASEGPASEYGYAYTGQGFITQETFWFYSCVLMTCVNTVAIRLTDIESIRVVEDTAPSGLETHRDVGAIMIHVSKDTTGDTQEPLILQPLMMNVNAVASMLRIAMDNAKSAEPMPVNKLFKKVHSVATSYATSALVYAGATKRPTLKSNTALQQRQRGDSEPIRVSFELSGTEGPNLRRAATIQGARQEPPPPPITDPDDLPSHIAEPKEPSSCQCNDHLERLEKELVLPISAKRLYDMMFALTAELSPAENVWERKTASMEGRDLRLLPWKDMDGKTQRTLKYWMPVTNPIVRMKEAEVEETQVLLKKDEHLCYVVQISTRTAALPYADAFIPSVRYCITWESKSECKLACYLGVKWVKSVLVKSIITRAALKGMADSVHAFVRILEDSANEVATLVETKRKKSLSTVCTPDALTEGGSSEHTRTKESILVKESSPTLRTAPEKTFPTRTDDSLILTSFSTARHVPPKRPHSESDPVNRNGIHYLQLPSLQKLKAHHHLTPEKSKKAASINNKPSATTTLDPSWRDIITAWTPSFSFQVVGGVMGVFTLMALAIWLGRPPIFTLTADTLQSYPHVTTPIEETRAVYLRDLEQGVLNHAFKPPFFDSSSFQQFLLSRKDNTTDHSWINMQHYRLAMDLDESRRRLALMRHDMLVIFQHLNSVDSRLVENEYQNWLMNYRQRCQRNHGSVSILCDEIHSQLGTYFT